MKRQLLVGFVAGALFAVAGIASAQNAPTTPAPAPAAQPAPAAAPAKPEEKKAEHKKTGKKMH
ncbi:MAG TPA: signal peptidase, partial [Gammaproteobacteria bacterium]|nr:signal peptidase [Gammaproteobacteria bacterium]